MQTTVPSSTIAVLVFNVVIGFAIPAILYLFFRKKGAPKKNFWVGALVMLFFAFVLESIVNMVITSKLFIDGGGMIVVWKYALFGGLMAGLFEETGRLLAFKTVLRKTAETPKDALMYGAGHGGLEVFVILTVTMLANLLLCVFINHNAIGAITNVLEGEALTNVQTACYLLCNTPSSQYLFSVVERISAIIAQLGLSVIIWKAVTGGKGSILLYPLAIVLHLILNAVAVLCSSQWHLQVPVIEIIVLAMSLVIALFAWSLCHCKAEGRV